jgi:hypothetical protein
MNILKSIGSEPVLAYMVFLNGESIIALVNRGFDKKYYISKPLKKITLPGNIEMNDENGTGRRQFITMFTPMIDNAISDGQSLVLNPNTIMFLTTTVAAMMASKFYQTWDRIENGEFEDDETIESLIDKQSSKSIH